MKAIFNLFYPLVQRNQLLGYSKSFSTNFSYFKSESSVWGSKKLHRKIKLQITTKKEMADPKIEEFLTPLRLLVKEQV